MAHIQKKESGGDDPIKLIKSKNLKSSSTLIKNQLRRSSHFSLSKSRSTSAVKNTEEIQFLIPFCHDRHLPITSHPKRNDSTQLCCCFYAWNQLH